MTYLLFDFFLLNFEIFDFLSLIRFVWIGPCW